MEDNQLLKKPHSEIDEDESTPLLNSTTTTATTTTTTTTEAEKSAENRRSVRTKVAEVELHVYREGKGPIDVRQSALGGWDQDQLEVKDILEQYGFKSIYAFNPNHGGRTVPIRFHPKNGRSMLPYKDGSVIYIDGQPKDSTIKPVTRIIVGVAIMTILIAVVVTETPAWAEKFNLKGMRIPPWVLTCAVIIFTRMRKRTKDFLKSRGWC
ncbi:hypothetical protein BVRB_1g012430 [Beta vulgaris subsp. vulgaris]|uniref:uncharacterized protein LOC104897792 n=1 Tax=Beta vulgaris subsp. vulgaris TaxID=3555 RepID=UPI00053F8109|nr:uncharacterized protein LOC104897792 [Beta vulgaris subsp. vulgaris]KMT19393.1 hypothetical protein BVRB_1g012430 [Beta vulgaris subsp. vulgaris]